MSQYVWHVQEPSLLKSISAKHRSKFAAITGNGDNCQIAEKLLMRLKTTKQKHKEHAVDVILEARINGKELAVK
jgi:hypothetical protein